MSTASSTNGSSLRRKCGDITVTAQAPANEPAKPAAAAGSRADQLIRTRRLYCTAAMPVPQMDALLLIPNKVAGWVAGNTANSAGTSTRPPPPTIASTNPAPSEASDTSSNSIAAIVAPKEKAPHLRRLQESVARGLVGRCSTFGMSPRSLVLSAPEGAMRVQGL
jgi:hypothetical protein